MDRLGGEPASRQRLAELVHAALGAGEDDGGRRILGLEDARQGLDLLAARELVRALVDLGDRHFLAANDDALRVVHVRVGEIGNARRHRGAEERGLPLRRDLLEDGLDVVDEAHVEHLVGLVEDEEAEVIQLQGAAAHVVHDAAGRADHDVDAALQATELALVRLATVDGKGLDPLVAAEVLQRAGHLDRELARRGENERLDAAVLRLDRLDDREAEGGRLARACLGLGDHVLALEQDRDGRDLDRRRLAETDLRDALEEHVAQAELAERRFDVHSSDVLGRLRSRGIHNSGAAIDIGRKEWVSREGDGESMIHQLVLQHTCVTIMDTLTASVGKP